MNDASSESCNPEGLATQTPTQDHTRNIDPAPSLLSLPAELRLIIYEHTFTHQTIHVRPKSYSSLGTEPPLQSHSAQKYRSVISLLLTCKTTRKEATPTFNALVTFDLTAYYDCMAAVYELGPDICRGIKSIRVDSRLAKRLAAGTQQGRVKETGYRDLLPALRHVYVSDNIVVFGVLAISHDLAIRALRVYFGWEGLEVHFPG
ncbi:hypothetical protein COCVIDRAFT_37539 [Bipolaris victoriae FI3]|uniref:2EXR domain-containing protein n=1 Tax=Bipolaris victoriae (strain FI3) TaxID=930091 RepID=W7EAD8_BIPV3|nr:hypothetical protein COCVIDRAFT_37539 [Bipolaris victoriae FI3]